MTSLYGDSMLFAMGFGFSGRAFYALFSLT
jgi:hypothetical protein